MRQPLWILALAPILFAAPAIAGADDGFKVQGSNVTSVEFGQVLARNDRLVIPEGGRVTLYDMAKRQSRVCVGAYDGPAEDCRGEQRCSWWNSRRCWKDHKDHHVGGGRGDDDDKPSTDQPDKK